MSKTKQFCETSLIFEVDNIKKRSNSARLPSKMEGWVWVRSLWPRTNAFCNLFIPSMCCAGHEKWGGVIRSAARVTQNHLSKPGDLMLQNATLLRKSAPAPPNIFDLSCVYCIAPATRNSSLRILFKSPTPANVFWNCYETVTFWLLLAGCIVPCACHTLPHKTTLQRPKLPWCALYMLTSKRASRHNGVHFFDTQLPKVLEPGLFCAFWLRNVLRATTACTCSTAQLPKVVWD